MTVADFTYLGLFFAALLALTPPLGRWLAGVLQSPSSSSAPTAAASSAYRFVEA